MQAKRKVKHALEGAIVYEEVGILDEKTDEEKETLMRKNRSTVFGG